MNFETFSKLEDNWRRRHRGPNEYCFNSVDRDSGLWSWSFENVFTQCCVFSLNPRFCLDNQPLILDGFEEFH